MTLSFLPRPTPRAALAADARRYAHREQLEQREPACLAQAASDHDGRRQQRRERGTEVAAHPEQRLREAEAGTDSRARSRALG